MADRVRSIVRSTKTHELIPLGTVLASIEVVLS